MRLMSRRTRTPLPSLPVLFEPVVKKNTYQKILRNKEKQVNQYNKRAKDLEELKNGDTVRLIPPGSSEKQAVKARVNSQVGLLSYEVVTENGAAYSRSRRDLRRTREDYNKSAYNIPPERITTEKESPVVLTPASPKMSTAPDTITAATKTGMAPEIAPRPEMTSAQQPSVKTKQQPAVKNNPFRTNY